MKDIRLDRWADILVNYSVRAKPGQSCVLTGDICAMPLLEAVYEELVKQDVFAEIFIIPKHWAEILYEYGSDELLSKVSKGLLHAVGSCDLYIGIGSENNTKLLMNVSPARQALVSRARLPILQAVMKRSAENKLNWVYTHFPTASAAQESDMGNREYREYFYSLCHLNDENPVSKWNQLEKKQDKLIKYLKTKKELHFKNDKGVDLRVNVSSMKWVNCCGKINFPDGEVYTGPNLKAKDGGVNGVVRQSFPSLYRHVEVADIELTFEKGAVVEAKASKGESFLKEMIAQDLGAKYVGEIAIGTNYNVDRITKNILIDEKFGGTFHLALGKGYPETGNTNESALHWDIIFDLRKNGTITADGELFFKDGKFSDHLGL